MDPNLDLPQNAESVMYLPIMIGAYRLDNEERDKMICQLVLGGLSKMSRLVEKFSKRYCQGGDGEWEEKMQLCLRLESYLKARLKAVVPGECDAKGQ